MADDTAVTAAADAAVTTDTAAVAANGDAAAESAATVGDSLFTDEQLTGVEKVEAGDAVTTGEAPPELEADPELEGLAPTDKVAEKPVEGEIEGYKLKLPVGVKADHPEVKEFTDVCKEAGIKPEKAQFMLDKFMENRMRMVDVMKQADSDYRAKMNEGWIKENLADPEVGGDKFKAASNYAQAVIRKFMTKDEILQHTSKEGKVGFLQMLNEANIKNVPVFFKFMARVGKYVSEAAPVTSNASNKKADGPLALEDALFGDMKF